MERGIRQRSKFASSASYPRTQYLFDDKDSKKYYHHLLSEKTSLVILFYFGTLFMIVIQTDNYLPKPKTVTETVHADRLTERFSEQRARNYLNELSSIGPKPTGSYENEVLAFDYLLRQLQHLQATSGKVNRMRVDVQKPNGSFSLSFFDGLTSCYKNIKNIVVKVSPDSPVGGNKSLLINCHYDSVPTSPGASDDGVSCAIMLELLVIFTQHQKPLPHPLIFLFNGAEENLLQGSHGFITQHPWAKDITAFINLEASGAGGRELLFQSDNKNPWLLQAYASGAKYPHGDLIAHEVFQSGMIAADTDFRIFRDYGKIPGLDFAFVKNGYVYHTKHDTPDFVNPGSIQRTGENLLGLIENALNSPYLGHPEKFKSGKLVYFDFLGLFFVNYPASIGAILNRIIVVLPLIQIFMRIRFASGPKSSPIHELKRLLTALAISIGALFVSCFVCFNIAFFLGCIGGAMSWYSKPYWIFGLYVCPSIASMIAVHWYFVIRRRKDGGDDWLAEEVNFEAARLFWIMLMCIIMGCNFHSVYTNACFLFFPTVLRLLGDSWVKSPEKDSNKRVVINLIMQFFPLLLALSDVWLVYEIFIPIMGRTGAANQPEYFIGIITGFFTFCSFSYIITLIQLVREIHKTLITLVVITIVTLGIICLTPLGFPYSDNPKSPSLQRFFIMHIERTFHNKAGEITANDWGFWIVPLDFNGPESLYPHISELKNAELMDCSKELYCGMPYYFPVVTKLSKTYYLKSVKPKIHTHKKFQLISYKAMDNNIRRLIFRATGPSHMGIVLCPYQRISIVKWSFGDDKPFAGPKWQGRPTYFIFYSYGENSPPWEFWVDFSVPPDYPKQSAVVDVAFASHFLHGHDSVTAPFKEFLDKMPSWVHITPWTSTYDSYIF
ncbi:endoplasmic reticulum metallopeptidase 1-like [Centruroides vittatus]|uniref:endoplasmic reticulum metallopeptidase 1-like n=1 Tax=Centruroides vittatus TaxID=120091 RepID=UPI00350F969C